MQNREKTEAKTDDGGPDKLGQDYLVIDWSGPVTVTAALMWEEDAGFWRLPWQQVTTGYNTVRSRQKSTGPHASKEKPEIH